MNTLIWRTWKVKLARELRVRSSAVLDAALYFLRVAPRIPRSARMDGAIMYVAELLPARAGRMAKWVERLGSRKVLLLCHSEGYISEFAGEGNITVLLYRNAWHLRRLLRSLPEPWLIHGFAPKSHYPNVARKALPRVPYIHDLQDTLVVYYGTRPRKRWLKVELPHERECMAGADGLIAHSLEPAEGFRRYGIERSARPRTLFFPLYCDDDRVLSDVPKISDTELHLVYAGGVAGSHRDPRYFGNIQFFELIKILTRQGLHFHIYPSPTTLEADRTEYEALAKTNPCFHYHAPVGQDKLAGALGQYHFGLIPFFVERSEQSPEKLKYATALKLFNFFEAGLPVVVSKELGFQSWIAGRYGAGVVIGAKDLEGLAGRLDRYGTGASRQDREVLSLKAQTPRLLDFYERVAARS